MVGGGLGNTVCIKVLTSLKHKGVHMRARVSS